MKVKDKSDQKGMSLKEQQDLKAFIENTKEQLEKHEIAFEKQGNVLKGMKEAS